MTSRAHLRAALILLRHSRPADRVRSAYDLTAWAYEALTPWRWPLRRAAVWEDRCTG